MRLARLDAEVFFPDFVDVVGFFDAAGHDCGRRGFARAGRSFFLPEFCLRSESKRSTVDGDLLFELVAVAQFCEVSRGSAML